MAFTPAGAVIHTNVLPLRSNLVKWSVVLSWLGEARSTSEVERVLRQGGFEVDGRTIGDPAAKLDADCPGAYELRLGKKKFLRLVIE